MKTYLQTIRLAFSRELVRHVAARLGEREKAVSKALRGMVPMVLYQLVIRAGEGRGREILEPMLNPEWPGIRNIRNLTEVLAQLGSGPRHSASLHAGEKLLGQLFGPGRPGLETQLSDYAQLRPASALMLLRLVAAMVAAGLVQHASARKLGAGRLSENLVAAKGQIYGWLPTDLPRWPGFRRWGAVSAPHAAWTAELARPYWVMVLVIGSAAVLALLVLAAVASPAGRAGDGSSLLATADSARCAASAQPDSAATTPPTTW